VLLKALAYRLAALSICCLAGPTAVKDNISRPVKTWLSLVIFACQIYKLLTLSTLRFVGEAAKLAGEIVAVVEEFKRKQDRRGSEGNYLQDFEPYIHFWTQTIKVR